MGVTGSHKEPERDKERAKKSQRGPQREPVRARLSFVATRQNTVFFVEYALRAVKNGC